MWKVAFSAVIALVVAAGVWFGGDGTAMLRTAMAANGAVAKGPEGSAGGDKKESAQRSTAEELIGLEKRRQLLLEKEAALTTKEQELSRLATSLDGRIKELNASQKAYEDALNAKRKKEAELASERYRKMLKLFKSMRPEESARLLDKLDEEMALGLLDKLDQKTVIKLSQHINQPRLLKWVKENLQPAR